jgi:hypothetical protein
MGAPADGGSPTGKSTGDEPKRGFRTDGKPRADKGHFRGEKRVSVDAVDGGAFLRMEGILGSRSGFLR